MKKLWHRFLRWLAWPALKPDMEEVIRFACMNWRIRDQRLQDQLKWNRAQLMRLRVAQAEYPRRGWKVEAYIPEEVLTHYRAHPSEADAFEERISRALVKYAIKGIHRVDAQGTVSALVFEPLRLDQPPRAPEYIQVLFDNEGKYKMSDKLFKQKSPREIV